MLRFLAALAAIGATTTGMTYTTCTWGPGSDAPAATSPAYTLPIQVLDTLAGTLRRDHRAIWRRARNSALAQWGVPFRVAEVPEAGRVWDDQVGALGFAGLVTPNAVTIFRDRSSAPGDQGGFDAVTGAGLAVYHVWPPWWRPYYFGQLVGVIGHEIGHALGFGHGGRWIMGGGDKVGALELAAARAYYGIG